MNPPTATVEVGDGEIERDVCGVEFRTRGEGGNRVTLAGGHDLRVDDEFAFDVIEAYRDGGDGDG